VKFITVHVLDEPVYTNNWVPIAVNVGAIFAIRPMSRWAEGTVILSTGERIVVCRETPDEVRRMFEAAG